MKLILIILVVIFSMPSYSSSAPHKICIEASDNIKKCSISYSVYITSVSPCKLYPTLYGNKKSGHFIYKTISLSMTWLESREGIINGSLKKIVNRTAKNGSGEPKRDSREAIVRCELERETFESAIISTNEAEAEVDNFRQ